MFSIMYLFNDRETFAEVFFGLRLNNSDPSITAVHLMNFLTRWVRFDTPDLELEEVFFQFSSNLPTLFIASLSKI